MQGSLIGVGPALRKARLYRGKTVDEASRDTRIRADHLEALEAETFDSLAGDVYVRGALRTYAGYLGLQPDRVVSAYARGMKEPEAPPTATEPLPAPAIPPRRTENHRLAFVLAAALIVVAAGFGLLSRSKPAPPAAVPSPVASAPVASPGIRVTVTPTVRVRAVVNADGARVFNHRIHPGDEKTFPLPGSLPASHSLSICLSKGGVSQITVSGTHVGAPGDPNHRYCETFRPAGTGGTPSSPSA